MAEKETTLTDFQDGISTTIKAFVNKVAKETDDLIIGAMTEYLTEQGIHKEFEINGANLLACVRKQIPKKPIDRCMFKECPDCHEIEIQYCNYCPTCGQKLDWSDESGS